MNILPRARTRTLDREWVVKALLVIALLASLMVATPGPATAGSDVVEIISLSNRADLVSGGDALLEVTVPAGANVADLVIDVDGRDVTDAFAVRADERFGGLVDGLALGGNTITATLPDGSGATLVVTNHPEGGPIFSGPQLQPWYCLEGALDEQCNREVTITYQYKSTATGQFAAYDPENPPSDVATTTTDEGVEVPYVVRLEQGNLNRSRYQIAMIAPPEEAWTRWEGPAGWNHKLYATHGAGCAMGHSEGNAPAVMDDLALSRGYAVISHALADNTEACNNVLQAESMMMVKERVTEAYGDIRFLMGVGCSGGSIAQLHMANAYPGLYDGLILSCTYPDIPSLDLIDCPALLRYFTAPNRWGPGVVWTEAHMAAATSQQSFSVCVSWLETFSPIFNPSVGANCDVPQNEPEAMYDPETNPDGVRCTYQDYLINVYGERSPERWGPVEEGLGHGFAGRPYGNVGLQYGLRALNAGEITTAQFVDLNTKVGAVGIDYEESPERVSADPSALQTAYRAGVINQAHHLDQVAMIDMPVPGDRYEFHDNYKSWDLRQRLINANGHADNHLIWYGPDENGVGYAQSDQPFTTMDEWLSGVTADTSDGSLAEKVVANRPDGAGDRCDVPNEALCDLVFGSAGNIRYGAGKADLANDVAECQLKPLIRNEYAPIQFSDPQWEALQTAFPDGVCDWTKPGVGQQPAVPWQTYAEGPGGRALGPAPVSVPFGPGGSTVDRIGGANRTATAAMISAADRDSADTVVLASAGSAADALTASPLAVQSDAPLLLTDSGQLSPATAAEIQRLAPSRVVVVGGAAAINETVLLEVEALGPVVERIGGGDRIGTAAAVANALEPAGATEVVIAPSDAFADALSGAALAASLRVPLLLSGPDALPNATIDAMRRATRATIVGGEGVIGAAVASQVAGLVDDVARAGGADRYATSSAAADVVLARGGTALTIWVATGTDFPDALVSGAAAARDRGVLVLVDPADLDRSPAIRDWLAAHDVRRLLIAGGPAAVSVEVEGALRALTGAG